MKIIIHTSKRVLFWSFAIFIVLLAIAISFGRIYIPMLVQDRSKIETIVSGILNQPVRIGAIDAGWQGFQPTFMLSNVTVMNDKRTKNILKVNQLNIGINLFQSLYKHQLMLSGLLVKGSHLTIRQQENGQYAIDGINYPNNISATTNENNLDDIVAWILSEKIVSLEDVNIHFILKDGTKITIAKLHLHLYAQSDKYQLAGEAQLTNQAQLTPLKFVAELKGDTSSVAALEAKLYVKISNLKIRSWLSQYMLFANYTINDGLISAETWAHWKNYQWQSVQSDFRIANLQANKIKNNNALSNKVCPRTGNKEKYPDKIEVNYASGIIKWQRLANKSWKIIANQLRLVLNHQAWPETQFDITANKPIVGFPINYQLYFKYLNVNDLLLLLPWLNNLLPVSIQTAISQMHPQGQLENVVFQYSIGKQTTPGSWSIATDLKSISLAPWQKIPGIKGLSGHLFLNPASGALHIASDNLQLHLPQVFRKPLDFNQLQLQLDWQHAVDGWHFKFPYLFAQNQEAKVSGCGVFLLPNDNSSPLLSLLVTGTGQNIGHISNYLPFSVLDPKVLSWLDHAITQVQDGEFTALINGPIDDFPFDDGKGTFRLDAKANGVNLAYWPHWPVATHLGGTMHFAGRKMDIAIDTGQILNAQLNTIHAQIPYMGPKQEAILQLTGTAQGSLNDGIQFLQQSPLSELLGSSLKDVIAQGPMQLKLKLNLPLENTKTPLQVTGDINMQQGGLAIPSKNLALDQIQGNLSFTQDGLSSAPIMARLFGEPVQIRFVTQKAADTYTTIASISGILNADVTKQQLKSSLLSAMSGKTSYEATLKLRTADPHKTNELNLNSNLQGLAIALPAPFTKLAEEIYPINLQAKFSPARPLVLTSNYKDAKLQLISRKSDWLFSLHSPTIAGQVIIPNTGVLQGLQIRLQHLYINSDKSSEITRFKPQDFAPLSFSCLDFRYNKKLFGQINVNLSKAQAGAIIDHLKMSSPVYNLLARGKWNYQHDKQQTFLTGSLASNDFGGLLRSWDLTPWMQSKQAAINFNLNWLSVPYDPKLENLAGTVDFDLRSGRIIDIGKEATAKMNLGRLLSLLSLQTVTRRLQLDFSDLTDKGFSFDEMQGRLVLNKGSANIDSLTIDGPVAQVEMTGKIDLIEQNYDLVLHITPHVTSSLPVVAALAGGPVVGVVTWVADRLLSHQLQQIVTVSYRVTGKWNNPQVKQLSK